MSYWPYWRQFGPCDESLWSPALASASTWSGYIQAVYTPWFASPDPPTDRNTEYSRFRIFEKFVVPAQGISARPDHSVGTVMHTVIIQIIQTAGGTRARRGALGTSMGTKAASPTFPQGRCTPPGPPKAARGARPGRRIETWAASGHTPAPSEDPVDKFIYRVRTYVRHPGRAVRDVASFAVDSCRLVAHVSKPSPSETFKTAVVVLVVVALFVGLLHASNVGLLAVRSVGSHLLHHLR